MIWLVAVVLNTPVAGCSRDENLETGSNPRRRIYYGYMEYVRAPLNPPLQLTLLIYCLAAGAGKTKLV